MITELARQLSPEAHDTPNKQFAKTYYNDPVAFVHDCFRWENGRTPAPYQDEIIADLFEYKRVAVRACHGAGKSSMAAWLILFFALTRDAAGIDWKIATTASVYRQLEKFLWPEVGKWSKRLIWDKIGRDPFNPRTEHLSLSIKLKYGEAFAASSDQPERMEGAHADSLLYVFDESKTIADATFDAAEGAFSGAGADTSNEAFAFVISTPGEPSGRFYDIHARKPGFERWHTRHIKIEECIKAGRVSEEWLEDMGRQWGEHSPLYLNRCRAEFADLEDAGIIPIDWVERAFDRYREWQDAEGELPEFTALGVDVARGGSDFTTFALRHGNILTEIRRVSKDDTMALTGRVVNILDTHGGVAVVDVTGLGAGVVDRLREQARSVIAFHAGARSDGRDKTGEIAFINKRAEAWWRMKELLNPDSGEDIMLPPDDTLLGDLVAPHYKMTSNGKIQVEDKVDIRARIHRSTDVGDAVVMAFMADSKPLLPFSWIKLPQEIAG